MWSSIRNTFASAYTWGVYYVVYTLHRIGLPVELPYTYTFRFDASRNDTNIPVTHIARNPDVYYLAEEAGILDARVTNPAGLEVQSGEALRVMDHTVGLDRIFVDTNPTTTFHSAEGVHTKGEMLEADGIQGITFEGVFIHK